MAVGTPRVFHPRLSPSALASERVVYRYDRMSDTFSVLMRGLDQPAVSYAITDFAYLRLDPETEEIIGVEIEDFLGYAVFATPAYLEIAHVAGITAEEIARIRAEIAGRNAQKQREPTSALGLESEPESADAALASIMSARVA